MLNEIFVDKVGIEYDMIIKKQRRAKKKETTLTYGMHITRYDFLRIAVAMLDDWNKTNKLYTEIQRRKSSKSKKHHSSKKKKKSRSRSQSKSK